MNTLRWIAQNEDGTYAVGEGDVEIATCKNREDAMRLKEAKAESVAWLMREWQGLTEEQIGDIAALFYAKWRNHEGFARAIEAALKEKNHD